VGHETLTEAMDWAAGQVSVYSGGFDEPPAMIH